MLAVWLAGWMDGWMDGMERVYILQSKMYFLQLQFVSHNSELYHLQLQMYILYLRKKCCNYISFFLLFYYPVAENKLPQDREVIVRHL